MTAAWLSTSGPEVACTLEGRRANLVWPARSTIPRKRHACPCPTSWTGGASKAAPSLRQAGTRRAFGVRVPAITLLGSGRIGSGQALVTVLHLDPKGHIMRIRVFGLGYVGAVSAACLAADGHPVVGVDTNPVKTDL